MIVVPVAQDDPLDADAIKVEGLLEVKEVFRLLAIAGVEQETTESTTTPSNGVEVERALARVQRPGPNFDLQ